MENKQWKLRYNSYPIADTGDYDGHFELTNGDISIVTKDDISDTHDREQNWCSPVVDALNELDAKWENWAYGELQYELHLEKEKLERMKKFMIAIGVHEVLIDKVEYVPVDGIDIVVTIDKIKKS